MGYFKETRGWGEEADRWLGEEVLAGWRMTGTHCISVCLLSG